MPRCAREKIGNGFYHICVRGNNKQDIFLDDKDREAYLFRLAQYKEKYKMHIYAYCLMTNHVHLLIYDNDQDISKFMQGLNLSYVIYFNSRHKRTGHLFQDRFTSVIEKGDIQLLITSKYIHLNPVKANIVQQPKDYRWSSYGAYLNGKDEFGIADIHFLSTIMASNHEAGRKAYLGYIDDQIEIDEEGEAASTSELSSEREYRVCGIKRLAFNEVYEILSKKWVNKEGHGGYERIRENGICIYLLGLISRLSWTQIAINLNINVSTVYRKVKGIAYKMVKDALFCKKINDLIFYI